LLAEDGRVVASIPSIQFLPVWLKVLRGRWDFIDAGYLIERVEGINSMVDMGGFWRHFRRIRWVFGNAQWLRFVIVARPCVRLRACASRSALDDQLRHADAVARR
jgi:hypothetical protein